MGFFVYLCVSACLFVSHGMLCFLPVLKERKKPWDCMNGEKWRIGEKSGQGNHDQKRLHRNKFQQNKMATVLTKHCLWVEFLISRTCSFLHIF